MDTGLPSKKKPILDTGLPSKKKYILDPTRCLRYDGKAWQCKKPPYQSYRFCEKHLKSNSKRMEDKMGSSSKEQIFTTLPEGMPSPARRMLQTSKGGKDHPIDRMLFRSISDATKAYDMQLSISGLKKRLSWIEHNGLIPYQPNMTWQEWLRSVNQVPDGGYQCV